MKVGYFVVHSGKADRGDSVGEDFGCRNVPLRYAILRHFISTYQDKTVSVAPYLGTGTSTDKIGRSDSLWAMKV